MNVLLHVLSTFASLTTTVSMVTMISYEVVTTVMVVLVFILYVEMLKSVLSTKENNHFSDFLHWSPFSGRPVILFPFKK